MLPTWVKKMGWKKMVLFLTILSTFISLGISLAIRQFVFGHIDIETIWISVFVPLIMTPLIGYFFFKVLYQLDTVTMQLLKLSNTDELTGVPNRRYFDDHLEEELNRVKRSKQVFSALMFDIDDFKQINDEFGHPAGDAILIDYACICQRSTRKVDKFARLGGDEFGLILPDINNSEAVAMAERLRNLLAGHVVEYRDQSLQATISIGVITWAAEIQTIDELIYQLDQALLQAKREGKNRAVVAMRGDNRELVGSRM